MFFGADCLFPKCIPQILNPKLSNSEATTELPASHADKDNIRVLERKKMGVPGRHVAFKG